MQKSGCFFGKIGRDHDGSGYQDFEITMTKISEFKLYWPH